MKIKKVGTTVFLTPHQDREMGDPEVSHSFRMVCTPVPPQRPRERDTSAALRLLYGDVSAFAAINKALGK